MGFDIYGNRLLPGHCAVHPYVHEEFPCSICMAERSTQAQQPDGPLCGICGKSVLNNSNVLVRLVHPPEGIVDEQYCRRTNLVPIGDEPESNLVDETIELPITFLEGVEA